MYSLSSLLKVFADQVDKAELRKLTKPYLKMGLTLQKLWGGARNPDLLSR